MTGIRVTVTVPESIFRSQVLVDRIKSTMRQKTAPDLRNLFKKTTEGWEKKPGWFQKFNFSYGYMATSVYAVGAAAGTYALVNAGAKPHTIRPSRSPFLRFQPGYRAATSPRILSSRAKTRYGNFISSQLVHHPGFEAREFDKTIAELYAPTFAEDMRKAVTFASKAKVG